MPAEPRRRPLRRDAAENRERILDLAERLCAAEGLEVSFHRIAQQLSVGVGTVYRHFPDRDALMLGLYRRYQLRVDELGEQLLRADPGITRVLVFIDGVIDFAVQKPVSRRVAARVRHVFPEEVVAGRWAEEVSEAVRDAKTAGDLRPDVEAVDVGILAGMVADLATIEEPRRSVVIARMRAFVLDSLRPAGAERPPLPGAALSAADLTALTHQAARR